jgi:hypothetical protein
MPASQTLHAGARVRFRACDVHLPGVHQVLFDLHGNDTIEGTLVQLSIDGGRGTTFAAIDVDGLPYYCIVAQADVRDALDEGLP